MIRLPSELICTGCSACSQKCPSDCITMKYNKDGFLYPEIDQDKCTGCSLCLSVCPVLKSQVNDKSSNYPYAYACINKDETIRRDSSSGGIFSLIASEVLKKSGVVFGAQYDDNYDVIHSCTECESELSNYRGSKYVQSRISDSYRLVKKYLTDERIVLFTGTPCQIAGLKSFLGMSYDNLLCVDVVCHGVTSCCEWHKYIDYYKNSYCADIKKINMRNKSTGWKQYSVSMEFSNDCIHSCIHTSDIFMKTYLKNVSLRPSCSRCCFRTLERQSDITLGDFWGAESVVPFMDDDRGTSLVLVHNEKGKRALTDITGKMISCRVDLYDSVKYNPCAYKNTVRVNPAKKLFSVLTKLGIQKNIDHSRRSVRKKGI